MNEENREMLTDYIKYLISEVDRYTIENVRKDTVKLMLLSIIGEMYRSNFR